MSKIWWDDSSNIADPIADTVPPFGSDLSDPVEIAAE